MEVTASQAWGDGVKEVRQEREVRRSQSGLGTAAGHVRRSATSSLRRVRAEAALTDSPRRGSAGACRRGNCSTHLPVSRNDNNTTTAVSAILID
jgi:hypothetical protein